MKKIIIFFSLLLFYCKLYLICKYSLQIVNQEFIQKKEIAIKLEIYL